jgi:hypothetical protein
MGHQKKGTLAAVPFNSCHDAVAAGDGFEHLPIDSLALERLLQVLGHAGFVAGRVLGVDADQVGKKVRSLYLGFLWIGRGRRGLGSCGYSQETNERRENAGVSTHWAPLEVPDYTERKLKGT